MLELILSVGIVSFLLFYFASSLEQEHFILKLFLIIASFTILIFIAQAPTNTYCEPLVNESYVNANNKTISNYDIVCYQPTNSNTDLNFYKAFLWIYRIFWVYVAGYLSYLVLVQLGIMARMKMYFGKK